MSKIGVFDSGVGGLSVTNALKKALPDDEFLYRDDHEHLPYGTKAVEVIKGFVVPIIKSMIEEGCEVIVIACNTVTTTLISDLRQMFDVPFIGIEPMIKPAVAMTKSGVIAVCATPTTLASKRYHELKELYAKDIEVIEPDCSEWTTLIENQQMDHEIIKDMAENVCAQHADVIVLACTHYHWIKDNIKKAAGGRAEVLQPEEAIVRELKRVLGRQP